MTEKDRWKDRSKSMRCGTCMYWVPKTPLEKMESDSNPPLGRCRRNVPTMKGWPALYEDDWCGEHKLDENIVVQIEETKNQLFVNFADGKYLDLLGSSYGVYRPSVVSVNDVYLKEN